MNPVPRLITIVLFVVLTTLVVLLVAPVWNGFRADATSGRPPAGETTTTPERPAGPRPARALLLSQRIALFLAVTGLVLTVTLILSQALRPSRGGSRPPYETSRAEMGTLAKLAESSIVQGEELTRERDVRRRAEEDARLKQQLLTQSLDEKIRLGHDLHDGIIQSLYAAGLTLESVRALVKANPDEAERRLDATRTSLNEAIRDVRAYVTGLAPENLRRAGFAQALSGLLHELSAGRDAKLDIRIDDEAAALLTPEQSIEALQIAREAVSNALRHGRATQITVRMMRSDRELCLLVQDNGAGFDVARQRNGGFGLGNMQARATRLGAALKITSSPGEGARVVATLPILHASAV